MIFDRKITKCPDFTWFFPKIPKFYIIIARKIFSWISFCLGGGRAGARAPPAPLWPSPLPFLLCLCHLHRSPRQSTACYLGTKSIFLMKVATQEFTVFSCGDNAFSLNADTTRPTLYLTSHVVISWTPIQRFHRILTNLQWSITAGSPTGNTKN